MTGALPTADDLLVATDQHIRSSGLDVVPSGWDFYGIAKAAHLVGDQEQHRVAAWVGRLVGDNYLQYGPVGLGRSLPPRNVSWTDRELQSASEYSLTHLGHSRVTEMRRQAREDATDVALGRYYPVLDAKWLNDAQRRSVVRCFRQLRAALDQAEPTSAIGASKELVEAAARAVLSRAGIEPGKRDSLPVLVAAAARTRDDADLEIGRRLAAVVHMLSEQRNLAGAGHGNTSLRDPQPAEAHLAASAAVSIARFLLASLGSRRPKVGVSVTVTQH